MEYLERNDCDQRISDTMLGKQRELFSFVHDVALVSLL